MRCESSAKDLKPLLDGELSRFRTWRLRRHIARCPKCTQEWGGIQRLNTMLLSADLFAPEISTVNEKPRRRSRHVSTRLVVGALAMAILVVTLLILPTWNRNPRDISAAVAAAISHMNTWHLSGWKQIDGKRVPWDIWGRRKPFLFYEKIGGDITFDDGTQRLRIFPPNQALNRPRGLVIRTATEQQPTLISLLGPSAEAMVDEWNWRQSGGMFAQKPFRQTAGVADFRRQYSEHYEDGVNANQIYTISKRTWLPEQYQLHFQSLTKLWNTELLVAHYDVSLPRDVVSPSLPTDYRTVNLVQPKNSDLSVQAKVVALDDQGNILMQYRTRLAGVLLTPVSTFSVTADSDNHQEALYGLRNGGPVCYLHTTLYGMGHPDNQGNVYELYSPLEPIQNARGFPQQLRVTLDVAPTLQVKDTDFQPENGPFSPSTTTEPLFQKQIAQAIPVPRSPNTVSIAHSMPKNLNWVFQRDSLQVQVCQARFDHYYTSFDYQNSVYKRAAPGLIRRGILNKDGSINTTRPMDYKALTTVYKSHRNELKQAQQQQKLKAIVWLKRMIAARPDEGEGRWMRLRDMLFLAQVYKEAGQTGQMRQILRQLIQDYQTMPQHGGLARRQAEYASRTGQFPAEYGYKGPS